MPPLSGLRVLDFGRVLAGAGATRVLGNLGAEVVKVEWPGSRGLDTLRTAAPFADGEMRASLNRSQFFNNINADKKSVALDITTGAGRDLALRLAKHSDFSFENFSAGVMDRLGLGYADLAAVRPDIIYLAQPGWGSSGPYASYRSYGPTAQAFTGITAMSGLPGRDPAGWGFSYLDHMPAYYAAAAALSAVFHRLKTGEGQRIEVAQMLVGCSLTPIAVLEAQVSGVTFSERGRPRGNNPATGEAAPYGVYPCLGVDSWVAIEVYGDRQWQAFLDALGQPAWGAEARFCDSAARAANRQALNACVSSWTRERDAYEVMTVLQAHGLAGGVCQTARQKLYADSQLRHRQAFAELEHPETGRRAYDGQPVKFSRTPSSVRKPPPLIGEHTDEVLRSLAGVTADDLSALRAANVII